MKKTGSRPPHVSPKGLLSRRDLLRVGAVSLAANALPGLATLVTAEAGVNRQSSAKSVIFLWMGGGVTHIDSFDPKPEAPAEIRGTLGAISTTLPGVQFCETLPNLARCAHEMAVVRSFSHDSNDHFLSQVYTLSGRKVGMNQLFDEPNLGAVVSYLYGPRGGLPGYIAVPGITRPGPPPHNLFVGGWLGNQHAPFAVGGQPEQPDFTASPKLENPPAEFEEDLIPQALGLPEEMTLHRMARRAGLRHQLDAWVRTLDRRGTLATLEGNYKSAFELLIAPEVRSAFDLSQESTATRDAYGRTKIGGRCLLARRLVEAGARFVMVDYGYDPDYGNVWDNHNAPVQKHPPICEMVWRGYHLAGMDKAFAALIDDLKSRGLLDETLVVFLTEFGRTPTINARGGRDHWGAAGSVFFAGGGTKAGQVIGATDKHAAQPIGRSYTPADLAATIYAALGIDFTTRLRDANGRPHNVLDQGEPIAELL